MDEITIRFPDRGAPTPSTELVEFLALFRATYIAARELTPESQKDTLGIPDSVTVEEVLKRLRKFSPLHLEKIFTAPTHESPNIVRISQQSPLEITLIGFGFLLSVAVILSGGRIRIGPAGVEATLPALGVGIKTLRDAFGFGKNVNVGFGIKETTIKLNATEFRELMVQNSGQGGFQSFIRGLQSRINKQTRQLTLSTDDIEWIYRHKANPQKGGWQARIRRIFERHFPEDRTL